MTPLFSLSNVHVEKEGRLLLRDISLTIEVGEKVAVVGPNGAGKSTLMRVLAGLCRNYRGGAFINGHLIQSLSAKALSQMVSLVQQRLEFVPAFTVAEFLELHETKASMLDDPYLTLLEDRYLPELSGGELQRVVLAAAITQRSKVLLMDEPTSHLDPTARMEIERMIRRYHEVGGVSYVLVTHDIELALRCAERIIIMREGQILWNGLTSHPDLVSKISEGYRCPFVLVKHPGTGESVIIPG